MEVDDDVEQRQVDAARRHVGGHQDGAALGTELGYVDEAGGGVEGAVDGGEGEAGEGEDGVEELDVVARGAEDEGGGGGRDEAVEEVEGGGDLLVGVGP